MSDQAEQVAAERRPPGPRRLCFVGQTFGIATVVAQVGEHTKAALTRYLVRYACCGRVIERPHASVQKYAQGRTPERCSHCAQARVDDDLSANDAPLSAQPVRLSMDLEMAHVTRAREMEARAERIRQRRAENAARVAHAHQVAMAASPSILAVTPSPAVRVSPGFESHPRTMDEVLARARRLSSRPISP